jgi:hypothetical protein
MISILLTADARAEGLGGIGDAQAGLAALIIAISAAWGVASVISLILSIVRLRRAGRVVKAMSIVFVVINLLILALAAYFIFDFRESIDKSVFILIGPPAMIFFLSLLILTRRLKTAQ